MVRRLAVATGALVLLAAGPAAAANRVVGIGDFRWSVPEVGIDLGEQVTWVFAGPDTRHSLSPVAPGSPLPDSDPGPAGTASVRTKRVGERFAIRFTAPGAYDLRCRLHGVVAGRVTVSDVPGQDPSAPSPDPEPVLRPDRRAPRLRDLRVRDGVLRFALDEPARVRIDLEGRALLDSRTVAGHAGTNRVVLRAGLRPRAAGRYRLVLRPVDAAGNRGAARAVAFRRR